MKKYAVGFALGLSVGIAAAALAAKGTPLVSGQSGDLFGWTVIVKHKTACKSPYVRVAEREIECLK